MKVKLFIKNDMTVIDTGDNPFKNFSSYDYEEIIATVEKIEKNTVYTDFINPYRTQKSKFLLSDENLKKVNFIKD